MVTVVNSNNFDVPRIYPPSSKSTSIHLTGFPTFYSKDHEYLLPLHLSGKTHRIDPARKISVKAVEEEAGLGDGSAYYYKDIVQKIKDSAIQNSPKAKAQNAYEDKISSLRERLKKEISLKEKYRAQADDLKEQLSNMASQHNQLALMIQQYQYKIAELDSEVSMLPYPKSRQ